MATTINLNLPKPDDRPTDKQSVSEAFQETALAFDMLDSIVHGQGETLSGKANDDHSHAIADIEGLATALENKMPADTTFGVADLDDIDGFASAPNGYVLTKSESGVVLRSPAAAIGPHGHLITDITGLSSILADLGNTKLNKDASNVGDAAAQAVFRAAVGVENRGYFSKADPRAVAFTRTGEDTVSIKPGTIVEVDGKIYSFAVATAVTMPDTLSIGDYAIWIEPDGSLEATVSFSSPPVAGSRRLGGFYYAPGGNAAAYNSGGNTTPQINEFSIWDEKFRPSCPDPRGMALVAGKFWTDIHLLGVNHHTDGTSKHNVTIADGNSPPKVPTMFGGNGSAVYSSLNWWEAAEVMASHGKQLLSYDEFAAAMYGTKEAQSDGTDPVSTILRADYTSIWGIMLATGNMWVWGREFGGPNSGASWFATTGGRGSVYNQPNAARLGGSWSNAADAGSRASLWSVSPWGSFDSLGARGRSDHLCHV